MTAPRVLVGRRGVDAGEYVGRPTPLGNPYTHLPGATLAATRVGSRREAVALYGPWLDARLAEDGPERRELARLTALLRARGELALTCWCAALREARPGDPGCHADVLAGRLLLEVAR